MSLNQSNLAIEQNISNAGGFKGLSLLYLLPGFDIFKGQIPDCMQRVLLGIVRQFLNIWLTSSGELYFIRDADVKLINEFILSVSPPDELLRILIPLTTYWNLWKASECRSWLLFYSPVVLRNILPGAYYHLWLLLVNGMRLLLKPSVSCKEIKKVMLIFCKFVNQIPTLYGIQHVSYNVHFLLHVVDSAEYWGAPWAYSAFMYV